VKRPPPPSAGPWRYELGIVYSADGDVVADNVGLRDGPLVSAAPKLLAALEGIARRTGPDDGAVTLEQIERIALDAIAAAWVVGGAG
jgi:hypothetical protein